MTHYGKPDPFDDSPDNIYLRDDPKHPNITLYLNGVRLDRLLAKAPEPEKPLSSETLAILAEAHEWLNKRDEIRTRFFDDLG